jgi:Nucleotidyl transferase AbiEii toxin, Type IV TA system
MLHKDPFIIAPKTFEMIQILQKKNILEGFVLVGGTSLALQMGHRNSIDIDLFTQNDFEPNEIIEELAQNHEIDVSLNRKNTLLAVVDHIKTDFIRHKYPYVLPPIVDEEITFLSKEDISAMKLHAISNSGKRLKDFIDLYFLLEYFSLSEMIDFYTYKYANYNPMIALRSVNYFDDIDPNLDSPKMKKKLPFSEIKKRIDASVLSKNKKFG